MVVQIVRGSRSEKYAAKDWLCKTCGNLNKKKEYLVFDLPRFYCERCKNKYDGLVYFCLADVEVNGHSILPEVKDLGDKPECVSFAYAHAQEFNNMIENIILGDESPAETIDPLVLSETYYHIFSGGVKHSGHKMLYVGLLLKDYARSSPKDVERSTFSEVCAVGVVNFEHICSCIADGRGVVASFAIGKNLHHLKFGEVYQTPATSDTDFHAVMLIGAIRYMDRDILIFLNSWGKEFCALLDEDGKLIFGGVGMFEFDLSINPVVLSRSWERAVNGKLSGSWRKDLTSEELNLEMACLSEATNQMPTFAVKEINASGCYDEEPDDRGRTVMIEQSFGAPKVTKNGVPIAESIGFSGVKKVGASLVKQAANATNYTAEDGTTCATVLTKAIFTEGCESVVAGMNAVDLRQVGTSANGEREIGDLIAKAVDKVGKEITVVVPISKDDTVILDAFGDKKALEERAEQLRSAIEQGTPDYDKLSGGVAVPESFFQIGRAGEAEVGDRETDALNAATAYISNSVHHGRKTHWSWDTCVGAAVLYTSEDQKIGVKIFENALKTLISF